MKKIILFALMLAAVVFFGSRSNAQAKKPVADPTPTPGVIYCADSVNGCDPLNI